METDIKDIKVVLAFILRESVWSDAELLYLESAIKRLGLRLKDKKL